MKRFAIWLTVLCLTVLPVAAVPYTEQELEEYMQAIYCEQPWALDYPAYYVQFIDVDLDGRKELLSIEEGEDDAPKQAHAYAFMDAELSHRGYLTVGKLDVCRDPKTDESFMINRVGERVERLAYDPIDMVIKTKELSAAEVERLESYGYSPVVVTKAQRDSIKVYEDCYALFYPAYTHEDYESGEPPLMPTPDDEPAEPMVWPWVVAAVLAAVGVATAVWGLSRRRVTKPR